VSTTSIIAERYELRERVFSEGNQAAYLARDKTRGEEVLLFLVPTRKKLVPEADRALCADIEFAFGVAAPSLLPILDLRTTDDHRFLVMPRPEGENAWTRMTNRSSQARMSVDDVCAVADDLVAAAKAAHAKGTLLGCSPKQVWIRPGGGASVQYFWLGRPRAGEASDAKGAGAVLEAQGAEGAHFRAPECAERYTGDAPRVDQYFIAAILYGLLTGEVPSGGIAPVRKARKDVPVPMAKAVERGLARAPGARHESLDRFRAALHRRRPSLVFLAPIALVLLALWAGRAMFLGGAGTASWALTSEIESERASLAGKTRAPDPVPALPEETADRFAGRYADGSGHTLTLLPDGAYEWVEVAAESVRRERGLWAGDRDSQEAIHLHAAPAEGRFAPGRVARMGDGRLSVRPAGADKDPVVFAKEAWPVGEEGALAPLVVLETPLSGSVVGAKRLEVAGTVALPRTEVTVQGAKVPVVGTRFTHVLETLERGALEIRVEATAPDGFKAVLSRPVRVDDGAPSLDVARAELELVDGVWHLTIEGRAGDDGGLVQLSVNDEVVTLEAEGAFLYVRKGVPALAHAFAEVVAVDEAGLLTRRVLWPRVVPTLVQTLETRMAAVREALAARRRTDAERQLRELRSQGGLVESLAPEELATIVRGSREPVLHLDEYPRPPHWFENDGTREIVLKGSVEWFAPEDTLLVGGTKVEVKDGRFEARVQLTSIGRSKVPLTVQRDGAPVASEEVEVLLADAPATFVAWAGREPTQAQREASATSGLPLTYENKSGMRFVLVPPGAFLRTTRDGRSYEVRITRPYYLQVAEVSREQWTRHGGRAPPAGFVTRSGKPIPLDGARRPALDLSRAEAQAYAARLGASEGRKYRLPTEAEWEWAARAADLSGNDPWGGDLSALAPWANYADRSIRRVIEAWPDGRMESSVDDQHPGPWDVGRGKPNAFGIRDLFGNVAEWVADGWADYDPDEVQDPEAGQDGRDGIHRGGGWYQLPRDQGYAKRERIDPAGKEAWLGLRLVYVPEGR